MTDASPESRSSDQVDDETYRVALDNCAREPIHIPGRVQSFGSVVGFDFRSGEIRYLTENVEEVAGLSQQILGADFFSVIPNRELVHEIRGVTGLPTITSQRERLGRFDLSGKFVDAAVHRSGETMLLELEVDNFPQARPDSALNNVRRMLSGLTTKDGIPALLQSGVDMLRRVTGYDRVMAYQFLPNFDGGVVAEALSPGHLPFLGLRYPASDIPEQVRASMIKMPFRCIADIELEDSLLLAVPDASPLDMTLTHTKGVSPIHVEYLRNMGVRSTMNLPIIQRGKLWGLFALHHDRPRLLSPTLRCVLELFGHYFSLEIQQELEREILSRRHIANALQATLRDDPLQETTLTDILRLHGEEMAHLLDADGVLILDGENVTRWGNTPSEENARVIAGEFEGELFSTSSLIDSPGIPSFEGSDGKPISGVLALRLGHANHLQVQFFRNEETSEVRWAGHPEKRIEFGPNGPRLHPRASFDEYIERSRNRSRPWQDSETAAALELRGVIQDVAIRDSMMAREDWKKQKVRQDLLVAELNHRVKNILALVRSIARQSQNSAESLEDYTSAFEKRIAALASAHDLIGGTGTQWASLASMIQTELDPHRSLARTLTVDGPRVSIRSDTFPTVALVIHELVTNATKHGALAGSGDLKIVWSKDRGGVAIEWTEKVDSELPTPRDAAFGLSMIRRAIPHECQGETTVEFNTHGLQVRIWLPGVCVRFVDAEAATEKPKPVGTTEPDLKLGSVLIVEDNFLVCASLETLFAGFGAKQVHSASNLADSLELAEKYEFDVAILDMDLGGERSFPVAERLIAKGTKTLFSTGYGAEMDVPDGLSNIPRLAKPFDSSSLVAELRKLFATP